MGEVEKAASQVKFQRLRNLTQGEGCLGNGSNMGAEKTAGLHEAPHCFNAASLPLVGILLTHNTRSSE